MSIHLSDVDCDVILPAAKLVSSPKLCIFLFMGSLASLVVKASASGAEDEFDSRLRQDFTGLSHTSNLKVGTPVATLPGAWHYRVSAGTGRPSVSIL